MIFVQFVLDMSSVHALMVLFFVNIDIQLNVLNFIVVAGSSFANAAASTRCHSCLVRSSRSATDSEAKDSRC